MLEKYSDFFIPLLRVLDSLPNRTGLASKILDIIEQQYRHQISQSQLERNKAGTPKWIYNVRMCKVHLVERGFIESPNTGIWVLSELGHQWLSDNPNATHLISTYSNRNHAKKGNKFRRIDSVNPGYSRSNSKYVILDKEIETIKEYLSGNKNIQPTAEKLCDWVQFCYYFEMYYEATEIFSLVEVKEVNSWYYERTKKIAKVCGKKAILNPKGLL